MWTIILHVSVCYALLVVNVHNVISTDTSDYETYKGFKIVSIEPKNNGDVDFLQNMMKRESEVDFWTEPSVKREPVSAMVSPKHLSTLKRELTGRHIPYHITDYNVQETLRLSNLQMKQRSISEGLDLDNFNELDSIYAWMHTMADTCREGLQCTVYSIGESLEGRPIKVFKISKDNHVHMGYWIDATTHAREWLSTTTAVKILNHLLTSPEVADLVESYDWYVTPVVNPDGYVYSHTKARFWRKNRSKNTECRGTDLNRNYDYLWNSGGSSSEPCSEIYSGTAPASEPETQAMQKEMKRLGPTMLAWLSFHAYGNMWMFPYGNEDADGTCVRAPDHEDLMEVANAAADAVQATYNTRWTRGTSCEIIYSTTGSSMDFVKCKAKVKYAYSLEVRGSNFVAKTEEIQPTFVEVWNGVEAMVKAIAKVSSKSPRVQFKSPHKPLSEDTI